MSDSPDELLHLARILSFHGLGGVLELLLEALHHGVIEVENAALGFHGVHDAWEAIGTLFLTEGLELEFGCELGLHDFLVLARGSDHGQPPIKVFIAD